MPQHSKTFEDLAWWIEKDRAQAIRIIKLIRDIQREPFTGIGKPEPLKHELSGGIKFVCQLGSGFFPA